MTSGRDRTDIEVSTVVLVEGISDQRAVQALAARRGLDLEHAGVAVIPMGGATNIGHYLTRYGPPGAGLRTMGLYDEAEEKFFRLGLDRAGLAGPPSRPDLEAHGFFRCVRDLEDELLRALGVARVEELLAAHGDLYSFRTFQQQPAQHGKSDQDRLRRFMGTRGGRKIEYAPLLVDALDLRRVPAPLDRLLAAI